MSKIIVCKNCLKEKEHEAFGLCTNCYLNQYRQKKRDKAKTKSKDLIYILECNGMHKIGISTTGLLQGRIRALQCGNPFKLNLLRSFILPSKEIAVEIEKKVHEKHSSARLEGEWFDIDLTVLLREIDKE